MFTLTTQFSIGQKVTLKADNRQGVIIGIRVDETLEPRYLVQYVLDNGEILADEVFDEDIVGSLNGSSGDTIP